MVRKKDSEQQPRLPRDRALTALQKQLAELEKFKQRNLRDVESDEAEWVHLTESILEGAFGNPSMQLDKFRRARWAGQHNVMGVGSEQRQVNFQLRVRECDVLLRSLISALKLYLPEEEIKGVYEPGQEYAFYNDLSSLIVQATQDVFVVDAYLDERVFNLYVSKVQSGVRVRILSKSVGTNVEAVARMYAKSNPLALRSSVDIHDRLVFLDQRAWVIGQSIKDAAQKKPTYMVELTEPSLTAARDVHNNIWSAAKAIS